MRVNNTLVAMAAWPLNRGKADTTRDLPTGGRVKRMLHTIYNAEAAWIECLEECDSACVRMPWPCVLEINLDYQEQ